MFPDRAISNRAAILLICVISASLPSQAFGQQVFVDTALTAGLGYDDNPRLETEDELAEPETGSDAISPSAVDQTFGLVGFGITLGSDTPNSQRAAVLDASLRRYDDDSLDSESYSLVFNGNKEGLRRDYRVETGAVQDSTLETELSDTGRLDTNLDRRTLFLRPGMSLRVSETWDLDLDAGYSQVRFSENTDDLVEYDEFTAGVDLGYQLTQRFTLTAGIDLILFRPIGEIALGEIEEDDSLRFLLGVEYRLSERSLLGFSVGPAFQESLVAGGIDATGEQTAPRKISNDGLTYELAYTYEGLRSGASIGISQAQESSALGGLSEARSVTVATSYNWNERSTARLAMRYTERDAVFADDGDREYFEINPSLDWEATQNLTYSLNYYYRRDREAAAAGVAARSADSNSIVLELRYEFGRKFL